ncbi:MAG: hypothetical protein HKN44_12850 [Ilumatobacter sp.]|nr:hypothetical protein [Ilumatobacter sp.]
MDWFVPADTAAASELRREVRAYLDRHSSPGSDVEGAELAFSELLTNAVEHSGGNAVWVSLDWMAANPVVTIYDLGESFELPATPEVPVDSPRGRGLLIASHLTRELAVAARDVGNRVSAVLDVERPPSPDIDQSPGRARLPLVAEAVDGYFPREPFLRALVVELAESVDRTQGPAVAEGAIAAVGAKVGSQMETAFRADADLAGTLSPDQIATLYVGLKSAIGGDFYIVSVDDDKIVLGNRRCPFGEAVTQAPSLCRMTSSVFGGIGARNAGRDVAVHLEERIAVGDPECRVVIWLRDPPEEIVPVVHRYQAPPDRPG